MERYSKHPLSAAILEAAKLEKLVLAEASQISEKPGEGLRGEIHGHQIAITSRSHLNKEGRKDLTDQLPQAGGLECVMLIDNI